MNNVVFHFSTVCGILLFFDAVLRYLATFSCGIVVLGPPRSTPHRGICLRTPLVNSEWDGMGDFSRVNPIEKFMYRYYCVDIQGDAVFLNGTAFFPCEALKENLFFLLQSFQCLIGNYFNNPLRSLRHW